MDRRNKKEGQLSEAVVEGRNSGYRDASLDVLLCPIVRWGSRMIWKYKGLACWTRDIPIRIKWNMYLHYIKNGRSDLTHRFADVTYRKGKPSRCPRAKVSKSRLKFWDASLPGTQSSSVLRGLRRRSMRSRVVFMELFETSGYIGPRIGPVYPSIV